VVLIIYCGDTHEKHAERRYKRGKKERGETGRFLYTPPWVWDGTSKDRKPPEDTQAWLELLPHT